MSDHHALLRPVNPLRCKGRSDVRLALGVGHSYPIFRVSDAFPGALSNIRNETKEFSEIYSYMSRLHSIESIIYGTKSPVNRMMLDYINKDESKTMTLSNLQDHILASLKDLCAQFFDTYYEYFLQHVTGFNRHKIVSEEAHISNRKIALLFMSLTLVDLNAMIICILSNMDLDETFSHSISFNIGFSLSMGKYPINFDFCNKIKLNFEQELFICATQLLVGQPTATFGSFKILESNCNKNSIFGKTCYPDFKSLHTVPDYIVFMEHDKCDGNYFNFNGELSVLYYHLEYPGGKLYNEHIRICRIDNEVNNCLQQGAFNTIDWMIMKQFEPGSTHPSTKLPFYAFLPMPTEVTQYMSNKAICMLNFLLTDDSTWMHRQLNFQIRYSPRIQDGYYVTSRSVHLKCLESSPGWRELYDKVCVSE